MADIRVIDAVKARMDSMWSGVDVVYPNVIGESPIDGSAYILVQFPASYTESRDVSTEQEYESGGVRFVIFTPRGSGYEQASEIASDLKDVFRQANLLWLKFGDPSSPFFDDSNDEGSYMVSTVVVPYTAHLSEV